MARDLFWHCNKCNTPVVFFITRYYLFLKIFNVQFFDLAIFSQFIYYNRHIQIIRNMLLAACYKQANK